MKNLKIDDFVTRYVAFENPRCFVENTNPQNIGGFELAVYYEPHNNIYHRLEDWISVEIVSYQGRLILLDCSATKPNRGREQTRFVKLYKNYQEAKEEAFKQIEKMQKFIIS